MIGPGCFRIWVPCAILVSLCVGMWSCGKSEGENIQRGVPTLTPAPDEGGGKKPESKGIQPMNMLKGEPLIGGCRDKCEAPISGFKNFIRALLLPKVLEESAVTDDDHGADDAMKVHPFHYETDPPMKRFIDVSALLDNGEKRGEKWAQMWYDAMMSQDKKPPDEVDAMFRKRQELVDAWLEAYPRRVGKPADPDSVEAALQEGVEFDRVSEEEMKFQFVPPPLVGGETSDVWTVHMEKRGLEWLVSAIYDAN